MNLPTPPLVPTTVHPRSHRLWGALPALALLACGLAVAGQADPETPPAPPPAAAPVDAATPAEDSAAPVAAPEPPAADAPALPRRRAPEPVKIVSPVHPPELWEARVEGDAEVECIVDETGRVSDAKVVSASRPEFGEAAVAAVRQWEFTPPIVEGQPGRMRIKVPLSFSTPEGKALEDFLKRRVFVHVDEEVFKAETLGLWPMPKQLLQPRYPDALKGSGKKGKAVVSVVIDKQGRVINPRLVKATFPEFEMPALLAAASLEFEPVTRGGKGKERIYLSMDIQFDFSPDGGRPKPPPVPPKDAKGAKGAGEPKPPAPSEPPAKAPPAGPGAL